MKKTVRILPFLVLLAVSVSQAADVGFDLNVNVGNRPREVVVPAPVYAPAPRVVIEEPPLFLAPPALGFSVAVGIPYDMVYISGNYYLYQGNAWYRSPRYNGPWVTVPYRRLPPGLRKHKFERIRHIREEEYRHYRGDEAHYRGKHFRPDKEWKEHRKEERGQWKEERKREKEERKHERRGGD